MASRSSKASTAADQHKLYAPTAVQRGEYGNAPPSNPPDSNSDQDGNACPSAPFAAANGGADCPSLLFTVGIDEAGRGCLAGPVVAAAVVLPAHFFLPLLNDSKVLSAKQRAVLAPQIKAVALHWSVGLSWPREIERYNILQATFHAMARAVHSLPPPLSGPLLLLVDGNKCIPPLVLSRFCTGLKPSQQAIVGGDALVPAISAASILAKTYRDHLMDFFHRRYPVYAFDAHKGYGTKAHMQALVEHGPCPLHRMTFAGVLPPQESVTAPQQGQLC